MSKWLSDAIFYEIYPQSFCDSNGDGIGDLKGILSKLDYIQNLGCNAVWLNPCFDSPFVDAGYDVRDYFRIAPRYGTNEDLKTLAAELHRRGMHLLLDLVPGHTSDECRWFQESQRAAKNEYTDRYVWTDSVWDSFEGVGQIMGVIRGGTERNGACAANFFNAQPALNYGFAQPDPTKPWQQAVDALRPRFPSYYVTLHKGVFWYYLEESREPVRVQNDYAYPLTFMSSRELRHNCLRVLVYKNRIAAEFFHALSDGHGGSVYLCNLIARYLELKEGIAIPRGGLLRDLNESPPPEELEDSFLKNAAEVAAGRREEPSYHLHGVREERGFKTLTTGIVETQALLDAAHRYGVTVTALLAAVMAESIIAMQSEERPRRRQRPVKITIPVDLRRLYGSRTLRNFSLVLNLGVDPRYGDYTLEELCRSIYHQIGANATPQNMAGMIAANVQPQQLVPLRLAPVFIKNLVMDAVYRRSGESGGSLNVSNITKLPLPVSSVFRSR